MKAGARIMERVYECRITTVAELEEALQEIQNQAFKQLFAGEDYVVEGWKEPDEEKAFLDEEQVVETLHLIRDNEAVHCT